MARGSLLEATSYPERRPDESHNSPFSTILLPELSRIMLCMRCCLGACVNSGYVIGRPALQVPYVCSPKGEATACHFWGSGHIVV